MFNASKFQKILSRQAESGLNVKDFCFNEGIPEATFYYWRKKIQIPSSPKEFIPLVIKSPQTALKGRYPRGQQAEASADQQENSGFLLEVVYPNGTKLRIQNDLDLARLRELLYLFD